MGLHNFIRYIQFCPRCGEKIDGSGIGTGWFKHLVACDVAIETRPRGGGFSCACGLHLRWYSNFCTHLREVDHDWDKLAVRRALEQF